MNRKQELFLTVVSNLILQLVTAVCGFILPPMIVRTFGSEINGMVSSITQFIAYLNLVEAGIGAASIAALYKPLAEKNVFKVSGILSAAKKFYTRSGLIFSGGIVLLAFFFPLLVGNQLEKLTTFLMVLILGISGSAEFFLIGKYRVLLTSDKKIYIISFLQAIALILNTTVSVLLIKRGGGILLVKFISSLIYLSRFLFLYFYIKRRYREFSFSAEADTAEIKQSKNALVHQISGFVVFNSPVIILTVFCGLTEVSVYSMYALIFSAVSNLASTLSNGLQSFFGESLVKDSNERLKKFFSSYETVYFVMVFTLYSCTFILIMPFMSLYTAKLSDALYIRPPLAVLFVTAGVLTNLRSPGSQLISAAGHFKETQWRSVAESLINITASVLFTLKFGIYGVLMGNICSSLYRGFDIISYSNRRILFQSCRKSFIKILVLFIVFVPAVFLIQKIPFMFAAWKNWIINALLVTAVCSVPSFVIFLLVIKSWKRGQM